MKVNLQKEPNFTLITRYSIVRLICHYELIKFGHSVNFNMETKRVHQLVVCIMV